MSPKLITRMQTCSPLIHKNNTTSVYDIKHLCPARPRSSALLPPPPAGGEARPAWLPVVVMVVEDGARGAVVLPPARVVAECP